MSRVDEDKWNRRYRDGAYSERRYPGVLVERWLPRLRISSARPHAVDIGCGAGRNALHLARSGWSVTALDISQVALDRLAAAAAEEQLSIDCIQADLESNVPLPSALTVERRYDLALLMRYTNLPLTRGLKPALKPGGYLIVELHLQSDADVVGPRNPKFRVAPGELRKLADPFEIVDYREGLVDEPDGRVAALAQLVARAGRTSGND